jgi:hypothetical protein
MKKSRASKTFELCYQRVECGVGGKYCDRSKALRGPRGRKLTTEGRYKGDYSEGMSSTSSGVGSGKGMEHGVGTCDADGGRLRGWRRNGFLVWVREMGDAR